VQQRLAGLRDLDGELIVGPPNDGNKVLPRTTSGVMKRSGKPDFTYHVFDSLDDSLGFQSRLTNAGIAVKNAQERGFPVVRHKHILISEPSHLQDFAERAVKDGYEGACLRRLDGLY